jgi:hypothetical protein
MARNGNAVLLAARQFQFSLASMQLQTRLLSFRGPDGGADAGGLPDVGPADGGSDAGGPSDGGSPDGSDAGSTVDAGVADGGDGGFGDAGADSGVPDGGGVDAGAVDAGLQETRSYAVGCGCAVSVELQALVLGLLAFGARRRR